MKTVLSIAGSDCSGGAGIQADIKTITAHGLYAMSVITAITAQNTVGVRAIEDIRPSMVRDQLQCVFDDIPPDAIKIGMVSSVPIIECIAEMLSAEASQSIVVDPVMISTSGRHLLRSDAVSSLVSRLLPLATLVTPNLPESETLCGFSIDNPKDMERAARQIAQRFSCAVLVKGGHASCMADDVLFHEEQLTWFHGNRVDTADCHGTGCTLSSAIACGLAQGQCLTESIASAKKYLTDALRAGLRLGHGSGPIDHMHRIHSISNRVG